MIRFEKDFLWAQTSGEYFLDVKKVMKRCFPMLWGVEVTLTD